MVKKTIKFDIYIKTSEQTPTYSYTAKQKVMSNDKDSTQITFNLLDVAPEELSGSSASILLYMEDGSFFQKSDVTINRNSVIYTMKPEETRHSGNTKVQIVLNKGTVQTASLIYHFEIERGLEKFPIVEKEIQDWTTLTAEAKAFVEQIKDFTLEGFVENKMGEELANLETNYATRLTGLEQKDNQLTAQLAQIPTQPYITDKATKASVQALASGAPLTASSTASMTDTSKVYVNTSDGKWYYYDGSIWVIGGIYQSNTLYLKSDRVAPYNIALGRYSQDNITTGERNSSNGYRSLRDVNAGSFNTATGGYSLLTLTTGSRNTAIGYESGKNIITQNDSTTIGYGAKGTTNSTSVGSGAEANGNGSVAIGRDSLGVPASAIQDDDFILGTSNHRVRVPGTFATSSGTFTDTTNALATYGVELSPPLSSWNGENASFDGSKWTLPTGGRIFADVQVELGSTYQIQLSVTNAYTPTNEYAPMLIELGGSSVAVFGANDANWNVTLTGTGTGAVQLKLGGPAWSGNITGVSIRKVLSLPKSPITINYKKIQTYADNIALGDGHGKLTSGERNTSVGVVNQQEISTGNYNTAVGNGTQRRLTAGSNNTAIGYAAQSQLTTGMYNNAVGFSSQSALTTGNWNNAMGNEAQRDLTIGVNNVAIGRRSQNGITTGSDNTAIGAKSAFQHISSETNKLTTASYQTVIGSETGQSSTVQADKLTAVGYRARGTTNALALGADTLAAGVGSVAIGKDSSGTSATASNANDFILGTENHHVKIPGRLNVARYTPSGTSDPRGDVGDITSDDNYFYAKTTTGWKRAALEPW